MSRTNPRVLELDFGMGNIRSLQKAFEHLGQPVEVVQDADDIAQADAILLPGDGAFGRAMEGLEEHGMLQAVREFYGSGKPVLGICIGFQILFADSNEFGDHRGLNFLSGSIERFETDELDIPHMGWTKTRWLEKGRLGAGLPDEVFFYYVHSYRLAGAHDDATAVCDYDGDFTAVVEKDNLFATQFHPEKSHRHGLKLLENFIDLL